MRGVGSAGLADEGRVAVCGRVLLRAVGGEVAAYDEVEMDGSGEGEWSDGGERRR